VKEGTSGGRGGVKEGRSDIRGEGRSEGTSGGRGGVKGGDIRGRGGVKGGDIRGGREEGHTVTTSPAASSQSTIRIDPNLHQHNNTH
jgi:hypothetical protein